MKRVLVILSILIHTLNLSANDHMSCVDDISILDKKGFEKHHLTFVNFAYMFKGRCRGHSLVTQKTFYLMEFNRGENPHLCGARNFPQECQSFYYEKLADLFFRGVVVEIPGFKNLKEFSSIPYIEGLLKYHVSRTPVTFKTLEAKNRFLELEKNPSIAHLKEAIERVQESQKPYLAISSHWTGEHAVLAYKFIGDRSGYKLCVRDPNLIPNLTIDCENYFYIDKLETIVPALNPEDEPTIKVTDEVFYHKRGEQTDRHLFKVRIYTEEDKRVKNYIKARYDYCKSMN